MQREGRESERSGRGRKTTTGPPSRNRREREREKVDCFPPSLTLFRAAGAARGRVPLLLSLPLSPALSRQRAVRGRCNQDSGGHNKTRQCNAGRGRTTDRPTQPPREKSIRYTRSRPPPPPSSGGVGGERGRAHVVGSGNGEKGRKTQEGTNRRREGEGERGREGKPPRAREDGRRFAVCGSAVQWRGRQAGGHGGAEDDRFS